MLGPKSTFSEKWAQRALERADAASPNPQVRTRSVAQRLSAVRQTVNNAIQYPNVKRRQFRFRAVVTTGIVRRQVVWQSAFHPLQGGSSRCGDLNEQFRFYGLQNEATSPTPPEGRKPTSDVELYVALKMGPERAKEQGKKSSVDDALTIFRSSLRELDKGARTVLSDLSVLKILPYMEMKPEPASPPTVECAIAGLDPNQPRKDLIGNGPGALGIELRRQETGGVGTVAMFPIWRDDSGKLAPIEASNFVGQQLPQGALVCLSHNAHWLLTWPLQPDGRQTGSSSSFLPPVMQRITWIRTGPKTDRDGKWHAELNPPRIPTTSQSWAVLINSLNAQYPRLYEAVRDGRPVFQWFKSGDRVGFLITAEQSSEYLAMLWTTTGLLDPDPVNSELPNALSECRFVRDSRSDQNDETKTIMRCPMGGIEVDGLKHELFAHYDEQGLQLASASPSGAAPCYPEAGALPDRTAARVRSAGGRARAVADYASAFVSDRQGGGDLGWFALGPRRQRPSMALSRGLGRDQDDRAGALEGCASRKSRSFF